jgi:hypothetical protein
VKDYRCVHRHSSTMRQSSSVQYLTKSERKDSHSLEDCMEDSLMDSLKCPRRTAGRTAGWQLGDDAVD